jgi:uncharacterized membrane protein
MSQIGLGAGLMYFLDGGAGRRRRAVVRDRLAGVLHDAEDAIGKGTRDINNRVTGSIAGLRGMLAPTSHVDDETLIARVRSRLGRVVSHPHAVEVLADSGRITLRGDILAPEVPGLLAAVQMVKGVRDVDNQIQTHAEAHGVPALQGEGRRITAAFIQGTWSPPGRLIAGLLGLAVTRLGMRRGGLVGLTVGLGGLGLLYRAFTNQTLQRLIRLNRSGQGVAFQKSVVVHAPVAEVFELFRRPENFPRFMSHLFEVRRLDDRRHHWIAKGPAGTPAEWDSEITQLEPNRSVAWRSLPGSMIDTAGSVRFQPQDGGTRVDIRLTYQPPAGVLGHAVAALFGKDPKHAMDDDLIRLKSLLEDGRTRVGGHTVTRDEIGATGKEGIT